MSSESHTDVTGDDPTLLYRRKIGDGAFGSVHEVCPSSDFLLKVSLSYSNGKGGRLPYVKTDVEKLFARKLFHDARVKRNEIEHEAQAIIKICGKGAHSHIVEVLKLGDLHNGDYYFIDMELCDLNLDNYIHRLDPPEPSESIPCFIKNASPPLKAQQIWNVMRQIANGVKYIHSFNVAHRDIKPENGIGLWMCHFLTNLVLYSRKDSVWKLADFGFLSEATSNRIPNSTDRRGTSGYRAPELLGEEGTYNNKVDIWSMGCILYEIAVGEKLFRDDFATVEHKALNKNVNVLLDSGFSDQCKDAITTCIRAMVQIDFTARPSATDLLTLFSHHFEATERVSDPHVQIHHHFHPTTTFQATKRAIDHESASEEGNKSLIR